MQNKLAGLSVVFRWSPIKPLPGKQLPRSRSRHSCCIHGDFVYIVGGKDGRVSLKDIWRFHIGDHVWEKLKLKGDNWPFLEGHSLVSYKRILLLFGGSFGDDVKESALWIINPDVQHVRKCQSDPGFPQPSTRRHHSTIIHNGIMYVFGGHVDLKGSSSELWAFHIAEEEWEIIKPRQSKADMPDGRHGHSAVVYGRDMWIFGGMSGLVPKSDLWYYNFHVEKWTKLKTRFGPPALVGHSAVVVKDEMIIQGGEKDGELLNDFWIFSFNALNWTHVQIPNMVPSPRMWHTMVTVTMTAKSDGSARTSSMPYLQNKRGNRQQRRPRSSPAYSSARNRITPKTQKKDSYQKSNSSNQNNCRPNTLELRKISKGEQNSIPVVMTTPTSRIKEEKSPLLVDRHLSRTTSVTSSQSSLRGTDNPALDVSGSVDGLSSFMESTEFSVKSDDSYGYHQKGKHGKKLVAMDTFSHNVIKVLPYPQLSQDLVVEDLEIYENYFSDKNQKHYLKSEGKRKFNSGHSQKYNLRQEDMKNLTNSCSKSALASDETLDRLRSCSVGDMSEPDIIDKPIESPTRSTSMYDLSEKERVYCWEGKDQPENFNNSNPSIATTNFCEGVKMEDDAVEKTVLKVSESDVLRINASQIKKDSKTRETTDKNQEIQPYILLFGGKDTKGGSVLLESLSSWRCDVFLRHSDISYGEFNRTNLIV